MIVLRFASVAITATEVTTTFDDGRSAVCDLTRSTGPNYGRIARFWGYEDQILYAMHHDLAHSWAAERAFNGPSPTLWAVAHDLPPPPENQAEEWMVNTLQWLLAPGNRDLPHDDPRGVLNAGWGADLAQLGALLATVTRAGVQGETR